MFALMLLTILLNFGFGIFRGIKNQKADMLAQQASNYDIDGRNFHIQEQPMHENFNFSCAGIDESA